MSNDIILQTKNLTKSFDSGDQALTVLDNISIDVKGGSTCSIIGPSGSGKTTLLGLCAGLDQPTSGEILFEEQDITKMTEDQLAKWRVNSVGFVFQTFRLIPTLTALENVMVPAELNNNEEAKERAEELLGEVGLKDRMTHYPSQLSGGEQQRVALARAFINQPKILFADEPTGNLDSKNSEKITGLLFDLNQKWNATLVLVTHDNNLAAKTDRVFHFEEGRLVKGKA